MDTEGFNSFRVDEFAGREPSVAGGNAGLKAGIPLGF